MSLHTMEFPSQAGHVTVNWNVSDEDDVETARKTFDALRAKGFSAFNVKDDGSPGKCMTRFDSAAEKITLVAPLAGG